MPETRGFERGPGLAEIKLYGPVQAALGRDRIDSLSRCKTVGELLSALLSELGDDPDFGRPESVRELQSYLLVLVDDSPIDPSALGRELGERDRVAILSLSHGG
ncbi:MAG: MoaD/ThiS family protein [Candidatus Brockarchaeota archaeon]|nr:MoaD/ThiS family protein [Candidatus Brockarchaeota archaeon]